MNIRERKFSVGVLIMHQRSFLDGLGLSMASIGLEEIDLMVNL